MRSWALLAGGLALLLAQLHAGSLLAQPAAPAPVVTPTYGATAEVHPADPSAADTAADAASVVTARELTIRVPTSAPDALRYEPGVSIQQTAHGQASPYVRGMTGQQVVHLFDGVRMNTGIYRQGPNQYFFSVDATTLRALEVRRGAASVRYGSDALGGAILALPRQPPLEVSDGVRVHPRLIARYGSADGERFGRVESGVGWAGGGGVLLGAGYRDVGRLESGGVVAGEGGVAAWVPRFESDGRTQLGTGFREGTFDARAVQPLPHRLRLLGAVYGYRQSDAPRTDQCPPREAPASECLRVLQQNRTLSYLALRGDPGPLMRELDLQVSYQRHFEHRLRDRPRSFVSHDYENAVDTLGAALRARTDPLGLDGLGELRVRYGAEAYRDGVTSGAVQTLTDRGLEVPATRGQYLDGSRYLSAATFSELTLIPWSWLALRGGGRAGVVGARAEGDPESGSRSVRQTWPIAVARAGVGLTPVPALQVDLNVDQGVRAPNLDDLTSRQQVGPGYQFENAALAPERATTYELGVRLRLGPVKLEGWGYATLLRDAIQRAVRNADDCPPGRDACAASRTQFQLVNASGLGRILGAEGGLSARLPLHGRARATIAYAWGEAPLPGLDGEARLAPISRIPPLMGTVELGHRHPATGLRAGAALRWAAAQRRLASSDEADARIPRGGTPGYAVVELRAGYQPTARLGLSLVLDNLLDAAYRVHGSSINGPGRSVRVSLDAGF